MSSAGSPTGPGAEQVPPGEWRVIRLAEGDVLAVVNTHGQQVVDCWAKGPGPAWMSMSHTRARNGRAFACSGDVLVDGTRTPVLRLHDEAEGRHDTVLPACDPRRYQELGHAGGHANCRDNLLTALGAADLFPGEVLPDPLNLFEHVAWQGDGRLTIRAPASLPGRTVRLEALADVTVILSVCPQDMAPTNGEDQTPRDVELRVGRARSSR